MSKVGITPIFFSFLKLGVTAFGGPAMIPYIRHMVVTKTGRLSGDYFSLGMAVAQSVPGATAMQMAAYTGLKTDGIPGALAAYAGFGLPAFAMMCGLSALYFGSGNIPALVSMFAGLKILVTAMILNAAVEFSRKFLPRTLDKLLALGSGTVMGLHGSPAAAILGVVILGMLLYRDVPGMPPNQNIPEHDHPASDDPAPWKIGLTISLLAAVAGMIALFLLSPKLFDLACLMMKVDLFAVGGGYVSIPLMLHEIVEVRHWMTEGQFMDGIALGQVTPGPIVMTAAFAGWAVAGLKGALVGAVAAFTPSFLILVAVVPIYEKLAASPIFQRALRGSIASLVGLMAAVSGRFFLAVEWDIPAILLGCAAFLALRMKIDVLWVVLAGAGISVLFF